MAIKRNQIILSHGIEWCNEDIEKNTCKVCIEVPLSKEFINSYFECIEEDILGWECDNCMKIDLCNCDELSIREKVESDHLYNFLTGFANYVTGTWYLKGFKGECYSSMGKTFEKDIERIWETFYEQGIEKFHCEDFVYINEYTGKFHFSFNDIVHDKSFFSWIRKLKAKRQEERQKYEELANCDCDDSEFDDCECKIYWRM